MILPADPSTAAYSPSSEWFGLHWFTKSVYEVDPETLWIAALLLVNCVLCCVIARRGYCANCVGKKGKRKYVKVAVDSETDTEAAELM